MIYYILIYQDRSSIITKSTRLLLSYTGKNKYPIVELHKISDEDLKNNYFCNGNGNWTSNGKI